ncbi:Protein of unknown function (DUF1676) [Nesidiocoris tenuis]|uniref:Protein osiris 17 n=1 Tax=Nesidiocoris tenuis TaxID=355587 RepID=A0ABN7AXK5_9HEMI|nr:Protein of unknown function (DUF1676) [Nesidiocoris tenuis]
MSCSRFILYVFVVVSTTLRVGSFDESAASVSESIGGTTESSKIDDPANATIADSVTNTIAEGLLHECWSSPSFACVQSGLRRALETSLSADFDVTDSVHFVSNHQKYTWQANNNFTGDDADNSIPDDDRFDSFVDAVEGAEGGARGAKVRHWHVGGLADVLYNRGARYLMTHDLNVELPEFAFGGGRIRVQPKSLDDDGGVWVKINFDEPPAPPKAEGRIFLKRIKQIFKKKLMTSFMAALLIIKLIKVKLMFLLPLIVGVTTAKKILLKALLFLFPALTHLFKLCAYYHHHHTKLSHHYHHHHGVNHHVHHSPPIYVPSPSYEYADHPPPGATIIHRSADNVLDEWGIHYEEPQVSERIFSPQIPQVQSAPAPAVSAPVAYPTQHHSYSAPAYHQAAQGPAFMHTHEDPFYSPILAKLDTVFSELGFTEEPCKERLVCSMYKAPARFSPHSNLVSAEISRDPSELPKPTNDSPEVLRYFRYVSAARNGQDSKDCLSLYPHCALLTE